ncbi:unnamed protein product [Rodentolepis nana]|uniref:KY-like immunoglobulin-like domain-containing protein n=1 Tax=Rodentolepis nana TaxID=102285 RepID=A0A3P7SQL6_RODNA|nr:unnamed protein product [Rodentolepis nana]
MEAVDRHNAQLICPATIGEVSGQHVLVSFDGWSGNFDYWARFDSRDLFPVGWCKLAGHALQSPGPTAVQRLNLTPIKMPTAPLTPIVPSSSVAVSALPQLTAPSLRMAARKSAPTRRKRHEFESLPLVKSAFFKFNLSLVSHRTAVIVFNEPEVRVVIGYSREAANALLFTIGLCFDDAESGEDYQNTSLIVSFEFIENNRFHFVINCLLVFHRLTLTGVRRKGGIRHSVPNHLLTKPDYNCGSMTTSQSIQPSVSPSILVPPPPLPRLTVITTTREDGSPQTIIKTSTGDSSRSTPTYASEIKTSASNNASGSSYSSLVPKPSGDTDGGESVERRHKKSKKRKRHGSKESHCRHSGDGEFFHQTLSFHDSVKPPKLVIRHRSGDFSGTQTSELFVDTMGSSPPLSAPFSAKFSPPPHSLSDSPGNHNPNNNNSNLNKNCDSQSIFPSTEQARGHTASHSTVSPASMDLGPCPLPNIQEWSTDDVYNYLVSKDSSLVDVASLFRQQEIDGPALLLVDMDTMRTLLNMKIGPALKVDDILGRLKRGHL